MLGTRSANTVKYRPHDPNSSPKYFSFPERRIGILKKNFLYYTS